MSAYDDEGRYWFGERFNEQREIEGMQYPMRCKWCRKVHDAMAKGLTIVQRYMDCTVWLCPHCGAQIDDRPLPLGSAIKVERVARRT